MTHVVLIAHRRSFHSTLISKCRLTAGNSIIEMLLTRRYNNLVNYFVFSDSLSRISTIMTGMVYFPCFLNQYFACFFSLDVVMNKHNTRTISIILNGITTTKMTSHVISVITISLCCYQEQEILSEGMRELQISRFCAIFC